MLFGPKLRCPQCGKKAKPRKHYEGEQCECQNEECGYVGDREEFLTKKQKKKEQKKKEKQHARS